MGDKKYLVVFEGFNTVVPSGLRNFVKKKITDEFASLKLDLDFTGKKTSRDLVVTFTNEVPIAQIFGSSDRASDDTGYISEGEAEVFVGGMRAMRLATSGTACEVAFPETEDKLGALIANTAIHEMAHMFGLNTGGNDGGGHTSDAANYMFDLKGGGGSTLVTQFFEYTVKKGDTLANIVQRYVKGTLNKCRIGPSGLSVSMVIDFPFNKKEGFIRDPKLDGVRGRSAEKPLPGEKVALMSNTLRTQDYKKNFPGLIGKLKFDAAQIKGMTEFVDKRIAAGKG